MGLFTVNLDEAGGRTTIGGSVADGVRPSQIPELIQTSGTCRITDARHLFYDPGCTTSDVTCGEDGECIPNPLQHTAGTVSVFGLKTDVSIEPHPLDFGYYQVVNDPYPAFEEGDTLTLEAAGGDFSPFTLRAMGIAPLVMVTEEVRVNRG